MQLAPTLGRSANVFYQCQQCGHCCKWPGFVKLSASDIDRMAAHLGMEVEDFVAQYTELHESRRHLMLRNRENGECVMYDAPGCKVHAVKPVQCAGFPNAWNFEGWQEVCEAIPIVKEEENE